MLHGLFKNALTRDFLTWVGESDDSVVRPIRILSIEVNRPFVR